jgi:hypothetical protein
MNKKEIEGKILEIDSRLKEVEEYIDAFKEHNQRILQWVERKEAISMARKPNSF